MNFHLGEHRKGTQELDVTTEGRNERLLLIERGPR
jgi:hypothetical protein